MSTLSRSFGHPDTLLREDPHWLTLLRPRQVTFGSLLVVCREPVTRFPDVSSGAMIELREVLARVESVLRGEFSADVVNYLMLMMVDPEVHFHVIPRYRTERIFGGIRFTDPTWPKPPDLSHTHDLDPAVFAMLRDDLRGRLSPVAA